MNGICGKSAAIPPEKIAREVADAAGITQYLTVLEKGTQLSVVARNYGTSQAEAALIILISKFAGSYNTFHKMTGEQVADFAQELVYEWWHYTLEDFISFFNRASKHHFGPVTNRMDKGVILEMLYKYEDERKAAIFEREVSGHTLTEKPLPPEFREGDFEFADCIRVIKGEATVESIIAEKRAAAPPPAAADLDPEAAARKAIIDETRVRFYVDDLMRKPDPRVRKADPFYLEFSDQVDAELARRRSLQNQPPING